MFFFGWRSLNAAGGLTQQFSYLICFDETVSDASGWKFANGISCCRGSAGDKSQNWASNSRPAGCVEEGCSPSSHARSERLGTILLMFSLSSLKYRETIRGGTTNLEAELISPREKRRRCSKTWETRDILNSCYCDLLWVRQTKCHWTPVPCRRIIYFTFCICISYTSSSWIMETPLETVPALFIFITFTCDTRCIHSDSLCKLFLTALLPFYLFI